MMAETLLESGRVTDFRPAADGGIKVYTKADNLRTVLRQRLGDAGANMLAIPKLAEDGDRVDWHTLLPGERRNWEQLTTQEREEVSGRVADLATRVAGLVDPLRQTPGSYDALLSRLLALALRIPANRYCYLVGDTPVLTFWGFDPPDEDRPPPREVIRPWRNPSAAEPAPKPSTARPTVESRTATPGRSQEDRHYEPYRERVSVREGRRDLFPWWIGPVLLVLSALLLSGVWYWYMNRHVSPPSPPLTQDAGPAKSNRTVGEPDLPSPPGPAVEVAPDPAPPDVVAIPQSSPKPVPEAMLPAVDPNAPEIAVVVPEPSAPSGESKPEHGQDAALPEIGAVLAIPPEARASGSVDFLNGLWRAETALQDADTREPVEFEYIISDGAGELRVTRHDGGYCRAPVTARMESGDLIVEGPEPIRCNDGAVFGRPRLRCRTGDDGRSQCTGQNPNDSRFRVQLSRAGAPGATRVPAVARPGPNLTTP